VDLGGGQPLDYAHLAMAMRAMRHLRLMRRFLARSFCAASCSTFAISAGWQIGVQHRRKAGDRLRFPQFCARMSNYPPEEPETFRVAPRKGLIATQSQNYDAEKVIGNRFVVSTLSQ
jgi:hypothetical protein